MIPYTEHLCSHDAKQWFGPQREKPYLLTYAPNENSNQRPHLRSLIWIFVARMQKLHHEKYLYNFDPLKPHFFHSKTGVYRVYIIFLIFAQNHILWVLIRTVSAGGSKEYPQSMFWTEIWKNIRVFCLNFFQFLEVKFSIYLNRHVFVMLYPWLSKMRSLGTLIRMRNLVWIFAWHICVMVRFLKLRLMYFAAGGSTVSGCRPPTPRAQPPRSQSTLVSTSVQCTSSVSPPSRAS